ncbi:peptidoglycan/LPS O-acetylase OafA/YrhL [Dermacoccus sp. GAS27A]
MPSSSDDLPAWLFSADPLTSPPRSANAPATSSPASREASPSARVKNDADTLRVEPSRDVVETPATAAAWRTTVGKSVDRTNRAAREASSRPRRRPTDMLATPPRQAPHHAERLAPPARESAASNAPSVDTDAMDATADPTTPTDTSAPSSSDAAPLAFDSAPPPVATQARRGRLPALDGVRALAVLAVMAFHFRVPGFSGGFLGVDIFFVLSGYLITSQLWSRWPLRGIDLKAFWAARVRRLAPAALLLLGVTTLVTACFHPSGLAQQLRDSAAALTYTSNWWYVYGGRQYGDFGSWWFLEHLWSLAIEEQFYLLWPLLVAGVLVAVRATRTRRHVLLAVTIGGALASSIAMSVGAFASTGRWADDPTRVYFGTDTHVMGLLVGAALALLLDGRGFRSRLTFAPATTRMTAAGVAALVAVVAVMTQLDFLSMGFYRWGGFLVFSLVVAALVWIVVHDGPLARALSWRPLRYVGDRSYGLYLWHWPLVTLPFVTDAMASSWLLPAIGVSVATFVLAELSYRYVEMPVRRAGVRACLRRARGAVVDRRVGAMVASLALAAALVVTATQLVAHRQGSTETTAHVPGIDATPTPAPSAPTTPGRPGAPSTSASPSSSNTPAAGLDIHATKQLSISVWGDSVPASVARNQLPHAYRTVDNHAAKSQQANAVLEQVMAAAKAVTIRSDVVLLHTGDNGVVPQEMLEKTLDALKDERVVLVLPKTTLGTQKQALHAIREAAKGRPWVHLVDWYGASKDHPEYFIDGVHPTLAAMPVYISLVQRASKD